MEEQGVGRDVRQRGDGGKDETRPPSGRIHHRGVSEQYDLAQLYKRFDWINELLNLTSCLI